MVPRPKGDEELATSGDALALCNVSADRACSDTRTALRAASFWASSEALMLACISLPPLPTGHLSRSCLLHAYAAARPGCTKELCAAAA